MTERRTSVLVLRTVHGAFALYFIACIIILYVTLFTLKINLLFFVAICSLVIEGFLVFILNGGHCPLAPLQKKLNDPVPFFNLLLPDYLAKKAVPFFTGITFLGILLLGMRLLLNK